jgi:hypothetical protein
MDKERRVYNSMALLAGLLFVVTGVRLWFRHDITGVVIHFALALVLFGVALLTGPSMRR